MPVENTRITPQLQPTTLAESEALQNATTSSNTSTSSSQSSGSKSSVTMESSPPPGSSSSGSSATGSSAATASKDVLPAPTMAINPATMSLYVQGLNAKLSSTQQSSAGETVTADQNREKTAESNYQDAMKKAVVHHQHHGKNFISSLDHDIDKAVKDVAHDFNKALKAIPGVGTLVTLGEKALPEFEHDLMKEIAKVHIGNFQLGKDIDEGVEDAGKMVKAFAEHPIETLEDVGMATMGAVELAAGDPQGAALCGAAAFGMADIALCDSGVLHGKAEMDVSIACMAGAAACMLAGGIAAGASAYMASSATEDATEVASDAGQLSEAGDTGDVSETGDIGDEDEMGGSEAPGEDEDDISSEQDEEAKSRFEKLEEKVDENLEDVEEDESSDDKKDKDKGKADDKPNQIRKYTTLAVKGTMIAAGLVQGGESIDNSYWTLKDGKADQEAEEALATATKYQTEVRMDQSQMTADLNALKTRVQQYTQITQDCSSLLSTLSATQANTASFA